MPQYPFYEAQYIKAQKTPSEFSLYDPLPLFRIEFTLAEEIREVGCEHIAQKGEGLVVQGIEPEDDVRHGVQLRNCKAIYFFT